MITFLCLFNIYPPLVSQYKWINSVVLIKVFTYIIHIHTVITVILCVQEVLYKITLYKILYSKSLYKMNIYFLDIVHQIYISNFSQQTKNLYSRMLLTLHLIFKELFTGDVGFFYTTMFLGKKTIPR